LKKRLSAQRQSLALLLLEEKLTAARKAIDEKLAEVKAAQR
jgi:hypothetical protein